MGTHTTGAAGLATLRQRNPEIHKTELSGLSLQRGKSRLKATKTRAGRCGSQGRQRAELGTLPPTESL